MRIRSVLVLTDFSADAAPVVTRAATIASRHQARLRLAYLEDSDETHLAERLARLALYGRQIARRHAIPVTDHQRSVRTPADLAVLTERADLLVLAPSPERRFGGLRLAGLRARQLVPQALLHAACPVLIVRNPGLVTYTRTLRTPPGARVRSDCRSDDLLIVTAPVPSPFERLFGRHAALQLVESLPCDVLIVPQAPGSATRPAGNRTPADMAGVAGHLAAALSEGRAP